MVIRDNDTQVTCFRCGEEFDIVDMEDGSFLLTPKTDPTTDEYTEF